MSSTKTIARFVLITVTLAWQVGCSKQDTECLARLGRRIVDQTLQEFEEINSKVDASFKGARGDAIVKDRIQQRLRWDRSLSDVSVEIRVKEAEVDLQGSVKTPTQRQRIIELAEATQGVEKVVDHLQVAGE